MTFLYIYKNNVVNQIWIILKNVRVKLHRIKICCYKFEHYNECLVSSYEFVKKNMAFMIIRFEGLKVQN